jgi:hypothetical protein
MTILLIPCLIICLASAYYVVTPLFSSEASYAGNSTQASTLQDQRERCIQVLRDLELDSSAGRLSAEDYQKMRASVGQELLAIVDQLKLNQPS